MTQRQKRFLVVGATGHVGSKVAIALADKGCRVTALVRHHGTRIEDSYTVKSPTSSGICATRRR